ncbi:unnamed protein product [Macrosiphum euphorbiae]|uniref:Uncharacterized protein n=1 Tax=Macrosiphum euphorbiae TaxID=13131 RepID=A0AAV0W790_9HEMI|nr:unnamed protein product [Macrosiphum euphorbiae]
MASRAVGVLLLGPQPTVGQFRLSFRGAESYRCSAASRSFPGIRLRLLLMWDGGDVGPLWSWTAGVGFVQFSFWFLHLFLRAARCVGCPVNGDLKRPTRTPFPINRDHQDSAQPKH